MIRREVQIAIPVDTEIGFLEPRIICVVAVCLASATRGESIPQSWKKTWSASNALLGVGAETNTFEFVIEASGIEAVDEGERT